MEETPVTVTLSQMSAAALVTQLDRYFSQSFDQRFAAFNKHRQFPNFARFQSFETDLVEARVATRAALAVAEGVDEARDIEQGAH